MNTLLSILLLTSLVLYINCARNKRNIVAENENPIIGIVAQEMSKALKAAYPGKYESFIAASYVKFIESGGARVIPIFINKDRVYYENIMSTINGVLFPGGSSSFYKTEGYAETGYKIYQIAKKMNDLDEYFPLWGTCLGFELLTWIDAEKREHRVSCKSKSQPLPLEFKSGFKKSRLYRMASDEIIEALSTQPVTSNFHGYCTTEQSLTEFNLVRNWKTLSLNSDWRGLQFISSFEHRRYPFYGVQFHPEKNLFEWVRNKNITHTDAATKSNHYFARFLVEEARKSIHKFPNETEEDRHVIYNFPKTFTGAKKSIYEESYLFKPNTDYPIDLSDVYEDVNDLRLLEADEAHI